jgi:hypothetical protein
MREKMQVTELISLYKVILMSAIKLKAMRREKK